MHVIVNNAEEYDKAIDIILYHRSYYIRNDTWNPYVRYNANRPLAIWIHDGLLWLLEKFMFSSEESIQLEELEEYLNNN